MFVYTPPPPSRRAVELGEKVTELLRIYKEEYPEMRLIDVQQALRIAERNIRADAKGLAANLPVLLGVVILLVLALTGLLLFFSRSGGGSHSIIIMLVVGLMVAGLGVFAVMKR